MSLCSHTIVVCLWFNENSFGCQARNCKKVYCNMLHGEEMWPLRPSGEPCEVLPHSASQFFADPTGNRRTHSRRRFSPRGAVGHQGRLTVLDGHGGLPHRGKGAIWCGPASGTVDFHAGFLVQALPRSGNASPWPIEYYLLFGNRLRLEPHRLLRCNRAALTFSKVRNTLSIRRLSTLNNHVANVNVVSSSLIARSGRLGR